MASNASITPLLRVISKRSYGSSAPLIQASVDAHVKELPNKIVIAAADSVIPISRISLLFKAGSRYETPENLGVSSVIRSSGGLTTTTSSSFSIVRNLQQIGASLSVTSDRESIAYTIEATSDQIEKAFPFLVAAATKHAFKPWELGDQIPRLQYEIATLPPQAKVLDLVNKAAYRSGLGNSIYVKNYNISKISSETLQYFVKQNMTAPRSALAGVGVTLENLSCLAESLELPSSQVTSEPAKYFGGELREEVPSALTHIALASEAPGLKSKDALVYSVLRYALGTGPAIKYGIGSGLLSKITAFSKEPLGVSAFSSAYSDSGLFGVVLSTTPKNIKPALDGVYKVLNDSVSDADVARGKTLLKFALLQNYESGANLLEDIGNQALLLGTVIGAPQIAAAVDSITTAQVQDAAKKIAAGKKSLAAYGNLGYTPYLDQFAK